MMTTAIASIEKNKTKNKDSAKNLKRELKVRRRFKRFENKIKQAELRGDKELAQRIQSEFYEYKSTIKENESRILDQIVESQTFDSKVDEELEKARPFLINVRAKLLEGLRPDDACEKARELLGHMTKGSQTRQMFSNNAALFGYVNLYSRFNLIFDQLFFTSGYRCRYTQQKFLGRALLIYKSLRKIALVMEQGESNSVDLTSLSRIYNNIHRIDRVCSIGCGPGNDFSGLIAFLRMHVDSKSSFVLEEASLLDWAIDNWSIILDPLKSYCQEHHCKNVRLGFCDITKSISASENEYVRSCCARKCIFCFSYILTEQREKWKNFIYDLFHQASIGSMFYFAEPIPWQLFDLRSILDEDSERLFVIDLVWCDSSITSVHLQSSSGREGPAVLCGIKCAK